MRVLFFDCFAGLSGDMTVGAMLSAGLPLEHLRVELGKLPLTGYHIHARLIERSMISAVKFDVHLEEHGHDHGHHHDHHDTHVHSHGHSYAEVLGIIASSGLGDRVKNYATRIFTEIARAEAQIHNVKLEDVHFHEVGAIDSIVDIVSVAIGLEYFKIERCYSRPVPLGAGGTITTAHGIMPVPTPAVLDILKGYPTEFGPVRSELTTPTGAGIIKALSSGLLDSGTTVTPIASGYGAGTKDFAEIPNLLRIIIGEVGVEAQSRTAFPDEDTVIEFTAAIDDMAATEIAYAVEALFEAGALDAYFRPIFMKKGRPASELVLMSRPDDREKILAVLAKETTTIGVRLRETPRRLATRSAVNVNDVEFGDLITKQISHGKILRIEPEYEEVKRIAKEKGLSFREVLGQLRSRL